MSIIIDESREEERRACTEFINNHVKQQKELDGYDLSEDKLSQNILWTFVNLEPYHTFHVDVAEYFPSFHNIKHLVIKKTPTIISIYLVFKHNVTVKTPKDSGLPMYVENDTTEEVEIYIDNLPRFYLEILYRNRYDILKKLAMKMGYRDKQ